MSIRLMALAFARSFEKIARRRGAPSASVLKLTALALLDHASDDGLAVHPSIAKTAARTDLSRRAVAKAIATFRSAGLMTKVGTVGFHGVIDYQWSVDKLRALPAIVVERAVPRKPGEPILPDPDEIEPEGDPYAPGAYMHEVHRDVGTTCIGTYAPGTQLTTTEKHQEESPKKRASRAAPKRSTGEKKPELSDEEKEAERLLSESIVRATEVIGSEGLVRKVARQLRTAGISANDVDAVYLGERSPWSRFDFRGQKGSRPTVTQIPGTIRPLLSRISTGSAQTGEVSRQRSILERAREKTRALTERSSE